ncbi:MAG: acetate--CoA ligase family protein [Planctomycetaceae bacterium]|jgi:acetyltransferase|nr:acetate--CoA ligase family protein [Planctomycetaceae bacterium]
MNDKQSLRSLLSPRSIAVIGASDAPGKVGTSIYRNLLEHRFTGSVYPVNAKHKTVAGQRAYASVSLLPETVELAVLCTPAATIPSLIEQCGDLKIPAALIITAGFREAGSQGMELQRQLDEARSKYPKLRILGPNCLGLIHPESRMSASFAKGIPQAGSLAFLSQSGALCTAFLDWSIREGIGFSNFVSLGNQLDVGFSDLLDYLAEDKATSAAILYIESITKPKEFIAAARRFTSRKPLIAYKAGRFAASAQAAASHTGSLAGVDEVYQAVMERCGIVRVYDMESMVQCAELLSQQASSNPPPIGERIAIVTNAGGPGVMASDMLIQEGGSLTQLSQETLKALDGCLPSNWSRGNPVDVIGDASPERFSQALRIVLADPNVDTILAILSPQAMTNPTETAERVLQIPIPPDKRVVSTWMGGLSMQAGIDKLQAGGIRNFDSPEQAIRGLMRLVGYKKINLQIGELERLDAQYATEVLVKKSANQSKSNPVLDPKNFCNFTRMHESASGAAKTITEMDSKLLLSLYQIPTPRIQIATNAYQAVGLADSFGYPVVLKVHSGEITHKTDVGGVLLSLKDADEVAEGFDRIMENVGKARPDVRVEGISVQPMVRLENSVELIFGSKKDPVFGPVILVGFGGVTAELYKDRALELPPVSPARLMRMLKSLQCWPLLDGYRGRPKVKIEALADIIEKYSELILQQEWIKESDLNPVLVNDREAIVLDARFIG